ncbi:hypothetical protein C1H46_042995 [Malus baccata]|uniref:Uncharacterized protein n=1 Tax=Malus baccata TaxID=106549 RepID=A0A540KB53_MALBA|nr:hypothetical protein C1H46_042995 [Malus baccata]
MESNRKRGGFMKGKLMPFYRAAKPISKTSMQYSSIAIATSEVKPSQATTSPAYSVGYTVHGQDYVIAAAQPKQKVSFILPAGAADHHTKNSLIKQQYFDHYGGAGDEDVDMKAASYISSVQERFKLERINS